MRKAPLVILFVILAAVIGLILFTQRSVAPITLQDVSIPQKPQPATKDDLIVLEYPLPGAGITSPLTITGKARGNWYFEGSFPVTLVNWDGLIIAEGVASAQGEWMTNDYVPFTGTITFTKPDTQVSDRGWIILRKDNPSGEPKFDNALEVEIRYK